MQLKQKMDLKLTDINHSHQCWQGHLPCITGRILWLTALNKHLPLSFQLVSQHKRGEAHPSCETENQSGFDNLLPLSHRAGNHLNEQKPEESAGCLSTSVLCFRGPSKVVCVWVRCSSGAAWLPANEAPGEKDREGKREVKGDSERERERDQGWGEIRWLVVSPPRTPSAQDSECSFISVSESFPAGSAALSVY